jgi:hypothetical protein
MRTSERDGLNANRIVAIPQRYVVLRSVHYPVTIRDEKLFQETSMSNFNGAHAAMSENDRVFRN